jgi:predicted helicase
MLYPNLALLAARQSKEDFAVLTTIHLSAHKIVTVYDRTSIFPLYLYTTAEETAGTLFAQSEIIRRPNLSTEFIRTFSEKLHLTFIPDGVGDLLQTYGPEDIFYYAYAVFHSPTYRQRYAEFLKIDFPRLPLTSDKTLFARLVAKGSQLVSLHLLKSAVLDDFITSYPIAGSNEVEKVRYETEKVWINAKQYFGGVSEAIWTFKVGGYQVCDKWLKDRKGRILSHDDITHYQRVVIALKETIRIMAEIDEIIPAWPIE